MVLSGEFFAFIFDGLDEGDDFISDTFRISGAEEEFVRAAPFVVVEGSGAGRRVVLAILSERTRMARSCDRRFWKAACVEVGGSAKVSLAEELVGSPRWRRSASNASEPMIEVRCFEERKCKYD